MTHSDATVFLVDDDSDIRSALTRALNKRGFQVEAFASADAFLAQYNPARAGCLVLDYGMPKINGLELQQMLIERRAMIPIIFITGHGGVPESVQAIRAGAIDFLEKPFRQTALVERIQAAFDVDMMQRTQGAALTQARDAFARLTDREKEIAGLMVQQPSDASSKGIARKLDISPRTVDHHRARILEKMGVRSIAELVDLTVRAELFD